jgi:hypothetical protein
MCIPANRLIMTFWPLLCLGSNVPIEDSDITEICIDVVFPHSPAIMGNTPTFYRLFENIARFALRSPISDI